MELDNGMWDTLGVRFAGSAAATAILQRVGLNVLAPINASAVVSRDAAGGSNGLGIDVRMVRAALGRSSALSISL